MPHPYRSAGASASARYHTLQAADRTRRLMVLLAVAISAGSLVTWLSTLWLGLIASALSCFIIMVWQRRMIRRRRLGARARQENAPPPAACAPSN